MRIIAFSIVKNEHDIIEPFVRHTLELVDRLVVVDNDSTDGTLETLQKLSDEGLPLEVSEDLSLGRYQSERMTRLMRDVVTQNDDVDWIVPLDADEFLVTGRVGCFVSNMADLGRPIAIPWRTYVPDDSDEAGQPNPVIRMRHRLRCGTRMSKVIIPANLAANTDAILSQGNHELLLDGRRCEPVDHHSAYLAHFPVRSPSQFLAKVVIHSLQYRMMAGDRLESGQHYRQPYEQLKRDPQAFFAQYHQIARRYLIPPRIEGDSEVVCDPIPYHGGELQYGSLEEDVYKGWTTIVQFAEEMARQFGVFASNLNESASDELESKAEAFSRMRFLLDQKANQVLEQRQQLVDKERVIQQQHADLTRIQETTQDHPLTRNHAASPQTPVTRTARIRTVASSAIRRTRLMDFGGIRNTILVAGSGRSGTSWIGSVIAYATKAREIFEPLLHDDRRRLTLVSGGPADYTNRQIYIPASESDCGYERALQTILAGRIRHPWCDRRNSSGIFFRRVVKAIRASLMLGYIANRWPEISIVFVVRNPLGLINSQLEALHHGWNFHWEPDFVLSQQQLMADWLEPYRTHIEKAQNVVEKLALKWAIENYIPLTQLLGRDNVQIVQYDALVRDRAQWCFLGRMLAKFGWDDIRRREAENRISSTAIRSRRDVGRRTEIFENLTSDSITTIEKVARRFQLTELGNLQSGLPNVEALGAQAGLYAMET